MTATKRSPEPAPEGAKRPRKARAGASAAASGAVKVRESKVRESKVPITERILQKAAKRLIDTPLVSVEIAYLQRTLGNSETESAIDDAVSGVRRLPWTTIAAS